MKFTVTKFEKHKTISKQESVKTKRTPTRDDIGHPPRNGKENIC